MPAIDVSPNTIVQDRNSGKMRIDSGLAKPGDMFAVTAPWCGHCNTLKKNVDSAQQQSQFNFFNLEGDRTPQHQAKTKEMGIEGFPTVYAVGPYGYLQQYQGGRSAEAIASNFKRRSYY